MTPRHVLILCAGGIALLTLSELHHPYPLIFWNASASVPRGLYLATGHTRPHVGDIVAAWLPSETRSLAAQRRYLPANVPAIKTVAATAGAVVCARGNSVFVDKRNIARRRESDSDGRVLPSWTGCKQITGEDVFLLSTYSADSFDGRYFGPTEGREIIAILRPLWTFGTNTHP